MSLAIAERPARMSPPDFRSFQERRPDGERWELYGGVPIMMAPPSLIHNRIASNLERLLNDALARHDRSRIAHQRPGLELAGSGDYRPEPDVAVIDRDYRPDQRFAMRAYLLAEIVSSTDREPEPGERRTRLEAKRSIYRAHRFCEAILSVEQDRVEVAVEARDGRRWSAHTLAGPSTVLALPAFGFTCRVGDLYDNTPLAAG